MPRMIVVAGPPGGGKSTQLGPDYFRNLSIPYFNIDDRCKEIHGSSKKIPKEVRQRANSELRESNRSHFERGVTFAFETTLKDPFAINQTVDARRAHFETVLYYIAAPFEVHFDRVKARSQDGGHSASEKTLRDMYNNSLTNLPLALRAFDQTNVYDGSGPAPILVFSSIGDIARLHAQPPDWVRNAISVLREPWRMREGPER